MTTPPPPAEIARLNAQPVQIKAADGFTLTGELSLPAGAKAGQRFPTVILLHGSGPNDMNVTLPEQVAGVKGGSAIFLQLAQQLNAGGFAVLRFNKRGSGGVGLPPLPAAQRVGAAFTISGYASDALAVLRYARTLPQVDAGRVFLLGHSEGTMLAAKIAGQHPELLRGIVLIGTVGDSFRDTLHFQMVERPLAQIKELFDTNKDGWLSIQELSDAAGKYGIPLESQADGLGIFQKGGVWAFVPDMQPNAKGEVEIEGSLRARLERAFAPYPNLPTIPAQEALYFADGDQFGSVTQNLPAYAGPVLLLHGEDDPQTTLNAAQKTIQAMRNAGRTNFTFKTYPGLGHTLAPAGQNGLQTLGPMGETPLNDLVNWLKLNSK